MDTLERIKVKEKKNDTKFLPHKIYFRIKVQYFNALLWEKDITCETLDLNLNVAFSTVCTIPLGSKEKHKWTDHYTSTSQSSND